MATTSGRPIRIGLANAFLQRDLGRAQHALVLAVGKDDTPFCRMRLSR